MFGNREFIQSVVEKKPNIFKKILNNIRKLAEKIKGTGANEYVTFVEKLKIMWEDAYYSNRSNFRKTEYSLMRGKVDINGKTDYNKISQEISSYVVADERKNKFTKYSNAESFFELEYERMNKAIAVGSKYVLEAQQQGLDSYSFNDEKYVYDFDIIDKRNNTFRITNVYEIGDEYNDIAIKTKIRRDSENSLDASKYYARNSSGDNSTIENGNPSNEDVGIPAREQGQYRINENRQIIENEKKNSRRELDNSSFSLEQRVSGDKLLDTQDLKEKQLKIIKNNNPVNDDYHTWIRNIEDIKTLEETINDSDWIDYDEYNPDLSRQDIENAIDTGKITVYSSYPIKQGVFVSPSKMEAESYSSNGKIYSKEVNINDVAWIDPTQGQYAKVSSNMLPVLDTTSINNINKAILPIDNLRINQVKGNIPINNNMQNNEKYSIGNAGYVGHRKSVRAYGAETDNIFPTSVADKTLGVSQDAIKSILQSSEWCHTCFLYRFYIGKHLFFVVILL